MSDEILEVTPETPEQSLVPEETPPAEEHIAATVPTEDAPAEAPKKAAKPAKSRKKPHIALRILMQLISWLLATALLAVVISGVVLLDLRQLTSADGLKPLISAILKPTSSPVTVPTPQRQLTLDAIRMDTAGTGSADTPVIDDNISVDSEGDLVIGGEGIDIGQIPDDILSGGDSEDNIGNLVDWLYDQIAGSIDGELTASKEQIQDFVAKSTVSDYLADKLSSFAEDFINGTDHTRITADELMALLEDNKELLESELNIELTEETKATLSATMEKMVEDSNINTSLRDQVYDTVDKVLQENTDGMRLEDAQQMLQALISDTLLIGWIAAAVVILLLLCLANFYNIPAGLTWAALPCIFGGGILSLPIALLQSNAAMLGDMLPEAQSIIGLLTGFAGVLAPYHYGLLLIGIGLLVISIVWRIIRSAVRKRHSVTA